MRDEAEDLEKDFLQTTEEQDRSVSIIPATIVENTDYYGKYTKKSRACTICIRHDHMEINLMRAKDHRTLREISTDKSVSEDKLDIHFSNHFLFSDNVKKILNLKESTNKETNSLVESILEGNADLYAGAQGVLESKGQKLHGMLQRIKEITDYQELRLLDDSEKQELFFLYKMSNEVENDILKTYQIIDKKLFPMRQEDIARAILSYKYGILKKVTDAIALVFIEFSKDAKYTELIGIMRNSLAEKVSILEDSVLKSGGVIQTSDDKDKE